MDDAMKDRRGHVIIGSILKETGSHVAGWQHPSVNIDNGMEVDNFINFAKISEAAKLDFVFLADSPSVSYQFQPEILSRVPLIYHMEPMTLLSAIATGTEKIGLVGTMSTTFNEPYNVARLVGTLDHISKGRAAWNVVTTINEQAAPNFGFEKLPPKHDRYARASEFVDVVDGLWKSWEPDAILKDRERGIFLDPGKFRFLNHKGRHFSVRGPLNVIRSPQGKPVIFVAASSSDGLDLGARTADAMFMAQQDFGEAQAAYADVKARAAGHGRDPDDLAIVLGAQFIVGGSEEEARAKYDALQSMADISLGLGYLSHLAQEDLSSHDLDRPPPARLLENRDNSRLSIVLTAALSEGLTLRETAMRYADGYGHLSVVGSIMQIADFIEHWFVNRAADGFALRIPYMPQALIDFNTMVLPELRKRGLFKSDYAGKTFRENIKAAVKRPSG
jgi:FMN-dependent oxidoreductase (nitrilotriacetate monooxygenase family)